MHAAAILGAAAALYGSVAAMPQATPKPQLDLEMEMKMKMQMLRRANLQPRADATAPWVTVGDEGTPVKTVTPKMTTVSGTPTLVDVAPHDITASAYTWTSWGDIFTSTGRPPNPTATSSNNDGVFSRCYNVDGEDAPFCTPYKNSTLTTGNIYYITWDPDYYNKTSVPKSNSTYDITVRLDYLNRTSNTWVKYKSYDDQRVPASWGFWPLQIDKDMLHGEKLENFTITLLVAPSGTNNKNSSVALPIALAPPGLPVNPTPQLPNGHTLSIALPVVFGGLAFIVVGLFLWNRKTRRIELGNIVSRSRRGYNGRAARRNNVFRSHKDAGSIQLHNADDHLGDSDYHDAPIASRRDSEALGSLAGTPIHENFEHQGTTGSRNAFRDEMARQNQERRGGY